MAILRKIDTELITIRAGTVIGSYVILEPLRGGRGGMAHVFKASLTSDPRQYVALKVSGFASENSFNPLGEEAETLRRLDHAGIVRLLPIDIDSRHEIYVSRALEVRGEPWFLVMEYLAGGSLETYLRKAKRLSLGQSASIACKVALALDYIHSNGVAHLDVKPSNVLFRQKPSEDSVPNPVLIDFGIAARTRRFDMRGGTTPFMSPERLLQMRSELPPAMPINLTKADVYSLGVVLYHMLTGRLPFHGFTERSMIRSILHNTPERPGAVVKQLPAELDILVMSSLEKQPDLRPTAAEFATNLEKFDEGK